MMSAVDEVLPNFLIVGAAKAGTTSLYHWLRQHPEVFMPNLKEPSYFVRGFGVSDWETYVALFEPGRGKRAIGEASVAHLWAQESPRWIYETLGDVRIIVLLRDPVQRALSLYAWMVMEGYEWLPTFERALAEEEERFPDECFRRSSPEYFWSYMYFRTGLYYGQVKRYVDTFGSQLVKVYLFEDLISSTANVYSDVCDFLGVSTEFRPVFGRQNSSRIPRSIPLQYSLRALCRSLREPTLPAVLRKASRSVARRLIRPMMSLNVKAGHRPKMPLQVKETLQEMYRTDIVRLGGLIRRDLSDWLH